MTERNRFIASVRRAEQDPVRGTIPIPGALEEGTK